MKRCIRIALACGGLLPCLWACARAPYQYQPPPATATAGTAEADPQLLFLAFRMQAAPRQLTLVQAIAAPGDAITIGEEEIGAAHLTITQLDKNQRPCAAPVRVPHPLLRELEYPGAASGTMERQAAALPEAEFFVRVVRQPAAVAVRVEETAAVPKPLSLTLPLVISKP